MIPTTPAASASIPQYNSIHDVYGRRVSDDELTRWDSLCQEFAKRFHQRPLYCARAPGRVNVLGEHIDYSLFPVLPAATQQDTVIALGPRPDSAITISNTDSRLKDINVRLNADSSGSWRATTDDKSQWAAYALSAVQECLERFYPKTVELTPGGMNWLVTGNLPQGAGLSSSAAFVVSMVMAFLTGTGNLDRVNKGELVALALAAEHRMGLRNGGLDHSASVMSHVECLTHLDFLPTLTATPVLLPPSLSLVISNSLTKHTLADPSTSGYNHRVAEVSLAAVLLANAWGGKPGSSDRLTLRDAVLKADFASGNETEDVRCALLKLDGVLGSVSKEWSEEEVLERCAKVGAECQASLFPVSRCDQQRYHLRRRAQHTFEEVLRLAEFTRICRTMQEAGSTSGPATSVDEDASLRELGRLISSTHDSLRDLYEATVPSVDELQRLCLEHGSLGSRQMGGGWGGAVISLVKTADAPDFMAKLAATYAPYRSLSKLTLDDSLFVTEPSNGASGM